MKKVLVAYFSASGQTARLAKTIAEVTGADLYEIKPDKKYTAAELDWNDKTSRSTVEMYDTACRPAIAGSVDNITAYDIVFVGFPIWWYEAPRIVQTFLESYDFSVKTVIPFATSGSSGLGQTDSILKKSCSSETSWKPGKRMNSSDNAANVKAWIDSLGIKEI